MSAFIRAAMALATTLASAVAFCGPVNINTADAQTIARELQGIGLSKAQAIVDYREKHGRFVSVEHLGEVKGVGARILELNRGNILIETREK